MMNFAAPSPERAALCRQLVHHATLAASSHNTQCWKFTIDAQAIVIAPDYARRCPVVDPDDHHLFVSLGCAAENLVLAALAHGFKARVVYDAGCERLRITLSPAAAQRSPCFDAIAARQCTRGIYDGKPLAPGQLRQLEWAASGGGVQMLLLTERAELQRVFDAIVQANTAQLRDAAFVAELGSWIRFNARDAARHGDGLWAACTGNPSLPAWLGRTVLPFVLTPRRENARLWRQLRSSAGIAVFVGPGDDKAGWIEAGRAYQRFALQATVMGIRHAHCNQPVELASLRPALADLLGVPGRRPDLVLRFGRGPTLPRSMRRPLEAVLS